MINEDAPEGFALRLHAFVTAAKSSAGGRSREAKVELPGRGHPRPNDAILTTYEECLRKLTDEELGQLDSFIRRMFGALVTPGTSSS